MATVTITITDAPGGVTHVVESDPAIPMDGVNPDVENLTNAQGWAFAIGTMMQLAEQLPNLDWRVFLRD